MYILRHVRFLKRINKHSKLNSISDSITAAGDGGGAGGGRGGQKAFDKTREGYWKDLKQLQELNLRKAGTG